MCTYKTIISQRLDVLYQYDLQTNCRGKSYTYNCMTHMGRMVHPWIFDLFDFFPKVSELVAVLKGRTETLLNDRVQTRFNPRTVDTLEKSIWVRRRKTLSSHNVAYTRIYRNCKSFLYSFVIFSFPCHPLSFFHSSPLSLSSIFMFEYAFNARSCIQFTFRHKWRLYITNQRCLATLKFFSKITHAYIV